MVASEEVVVSSPLVDRLGSYAFRKVSQVAEYFAGGYEKKSRRNLLAGAMLATAIRGSMGPAHAGVVFDPMQSAFTNFTASWMTNSLTLAAGLFSTLVFLSMLYAAVKAMPSRSLPVVGVAVLNTGLGLAVPAVIIAGLSGVLVGNCDGVSSGLACVGDNIGQVITGASAGSPDTILVTFSTLAWRFPVAAWGLLNAVHFDLFHPAPFALALLVLIIGILAAGVMILVGGLLAIELFTAEMTTVFSIPLVAWTTGFLGSPATSSIGSAFFTAALRIVIRFVGVVAVVAIGKSIASGWDTSIASAITQMQATTTANIGLLQQTVMFLVGAVMLGILVKQLPAQTAAAISGAATFSAGGAVAGASAAAASANRTAAQGAAGAVLGGGAGSAGEAALRGASRGGLVGALAGVAAQQMQQHAAAGGGGGGGGGGSSPGPESRGGSAGGGGGSSPSGGNPGGGGSNGGGPSAGGGGRGGLGLVEGGAGNSTGGGASSGDGGRGGSAANGGAAAPTSSGSGGGSSPSQSGGSGAGASAGGERSSAAAGDNGGAGASTGESEGGSRSEQLANEPGDVSGEATNGEAPEKESRSITLGSAAVDDGVREGEYEYEDSSSSESEPESRAASAPSWVVVARRSAAKRAREGKGKA